MGGDLRVSVPLVIIVRLEASFILILYESYMQVRVLVLNSSTSIKCGTVRVYGIFLP